MKIRLFIVLIFLFWQFQLSAISSFIEGKYFAVDTFRPNNENVAQLYIKALEIIMQNEKVFDGPLETPLYEPKKDTLLISYKLAAIPPPQRGKLDLFKLGNPYMVNCQSFYDKVQFPKSDHIAFKGSIFDRGCVELNNANIGIMFSQPFQSENRLYLGFHMLWNTIFRSQIHIRYEYFFELEVCDDNTLSFKKLFACISDRPDWRPYPYEMDELKYLDKNFEKIYKKGRKEIKYVFYLTEKAHTIHYYEIDLKDKTCK